MQRTACSLAQLLALFSIVRGILVLGFEQPQLGLAVYAFTRYFPTPFWGVWALCTGVGLLCCCAWKAPGVLWKALLWTNIGHWLMLSTLLLLTDPRQIAGWLSFLVAYAGMKVFYEQHHALSELRDVASEVRRALEDV